MDIFSDYKEAQKFWHICENLRLDHELTEDEAQFRKQLESKAIFVVIEHDRHSDDKVRAYSNLRDAVKSLGVHYDMASKMFGDYCVVPFEGAEDYYLSINVTRLIQSD